jgi:tRNA threonylcarbamoyl adenosine modification protein YjeE
MRISERPQNQGPRVLQEILRLENLATDRGIQERSFPIVLLLKGPLGVGKTEFVKSFWRSLGGDGGQVQSPTFLKAIEYVNPKGIRLLHCDFYRIEEAHHLSAEIFLESFENAHIICIEWAERLEELLDVQHPLRRFLNRSSRYQLSWSGLGEFEFMSCP